MFYLYIIMCFTYCSAYELMDLGALQMYFIPAALAVGMGLQIFR